MGSNVIKDIEMITCDSTFDHNFRIVEFYIIDSQADLLDISIRDDK